MEPRTLAALARHYDPALWEFRVRRADGTWLARPAPQPDAAPSNMDTWTRRIPDGWSFDSAADAEKAAVAHGVAVDDIKIIPAPRRAGDWLKCEGEFAIVAEAA